jgi:hypothetical protein
MPQPIPLCMIGKVRVQAISLSIIPTGRVVAISVYYTDGLGSGYLSLLYRRLRFRLSLSSFPKVTVPAISLYSTDCNLLRFLRSLIYFLLLYSSLTNAILYIMCDFYCALFFTFISGPVHFLRRASSFGTPVREFRDYLPFVLFFCVVFRVVYCICGIFPYIPLCFILFHNRRGFEGCYFHLSATPYEHGLRAKLFVWNSRPGRRRYCE